MKNFNYFNGAKKQRYRLYFGENVKKVDADVISLTLEQNEETIIYVNNIRYKFQLKTFQFNRKIYQPGEIHAEVQIMLMDAGNKYMSLSDLHDLFLYRRVAMTAQAEDISLDTIKNERQTETQVAINYYVYEIDPQLIKETSSESLYVKLTIYSMDKLMTLNKYSKTWVTKKLGSEILASESKIFGYDGEHSLISVNTDYLQHLKYADFQSVEDKIVNIRSEKIQPYLVQYNESFYDFMVRTANRCGEFFFFEDGKLNLGLRYLPKDENSVYTITNYRSVTIQDTTDLPAVEIKDFVRDSIKSKGSELDYNFSVIPKAEYSYPEDSFPTSLAYNSELSHDEYIFPIEKDKFDGHKRHFSFDDTGSSIATNMAFKILGKIINSKSESWMTLLDAIRDVGVEWAFNEAKTAITVDGANEKGNKKYIKGYTAKIQQTDGQTTYPFSDLKEEGQLNLKFYSDIRNSELRQQKKIIRIDMGVNYIPVELGDFISIDKLDGRYVVIQVNQSIGKTWRNEYDKYDNSDVPELVGKASQYIFAIPAIEEEKNHYTYVPPVYTGPIVRKTGPQTAFVTANDDPKQQGRVRIVFPWQSAFQPKELEELKSSVEKLIAAQNDLGKKRRELSDLKALKALLSDEYEELKEFLNSLDNQGLTGTDREKCIEEKKNAIIAKIAAAKREYTNLVEVLLPKVNNEIDNQNELKDGYDNKIKEITDKTDQTLEDKENKRILEEEKAQVEYETLKCTWQKSEYEKERDLLTEKINFYNALLEDLNSIGSDSSSTQKYLEEKEAKITTLGDEVISKQNDVDVAETNKNNKEKEVGKRSKELKSQIEGSASPWVRVATPMATEGGGVFFTPQVGDEVLVNFDNDNIERPYVVGSLYSKEVGDTRDFLNRTTNDPMQNGAGMAIVTPNGQHIVFKHPGDGKSFLTSFFPFLKMLTIYDPSFLKDKDELKDVALKRLSGGMMMSDYFGMYKINLSSHGRKIDIASPFGSVSMSAFTGITISAPNGDVKIQGKNVTIEAGNNLKLMSGTNITDKKDRLEKYFKAFASSVVKTFTTGAELADMTLVRCLYDVIMKPIEGTMLIKSKNYLRLEAGKGQAEVRPEFYSKKWAKSQKLEQDGEKNLVYAKMTDYINLFAKTINDKSKTYKELKSKVIETKKAYDQEWADILAPDDNRKPDLLTMFTMKQDSLVQMYATTINNLDFAAIKKTVSYDDGNQVILGKISTFDDAQKKKILLQISKRLRVISYNYVKALNALQQFINSLANMFEQAVANENSVYYPDQGPVPTAWIDGHANDIFFIGNNSAKKTLKSEWESLFLDVNTLKEDFIGADNENDFLANPQGFIRLYVLKFLIALNSSDNNKIGVAPTQTPGKYFKTYMGANGHVINGATIAEQVASASKEWPEAIQLAGEKMSTAQKLLSIGNTILEWSGIFSGTIDTVKYISKGREAWDKSSSGKILFSDSDSTYSFDGGAIRQDKSSKFGSEAKLKKALSKL